MIDHRVEELLAVARLALAGYSYAATSKLVLGLDDEGWKAWDATKEIRDLLSAEITRRNPQGKAVRP